MNFPFVDAGMINSPAEIAEIKTQSLSATNAIITGTLSAFNFTALNVSNINLSALDVDDIKTKTLIVESSGTGPALQVRQLGNQPIASFVDLDNNELVRINNNGYTVITNSLEVQENIFSGNRFLMTGDGVNNAWIGRQGTGTEPERLAIGINANPTTGLIDTISMSTGAVQRFTINNTGQVQINGPATDNVNKLHVTGAIKSIGTATNRPGLSIINAENFDPGQPLTVDGRARVVHGMTFQAGITNFADQSDHSHVIWASQGRQGWQFIQNGGYSSSSVNTFSVNTIGFNAATTPFNEANLHSIDTTNVTVAGSFPFVASNVAINFNTNTPALAVNQIVAITYNPGLVGFVANTYNGKVISGPTPVTVSGASRFQYIFEIELRDPINFDSSIKGFTTIPLNQANNLNALRIFTLQNEIQGTKVSLQGSYRGIPRYVLVNINGHNAYEGQTIIFRSTGSAKLGLVPADYSGHVKEVLNANQFVISLGSVMEGFRSTNTDSYFNTTDWTIIKGSNDPVHLYTPALTHLYFQRFQTSDTSSTTTGGNRAVALGSSAEVDSNFSYALGHNSGVFGEHSTVLGGKNNYILGTYSSIIGGQNVTIPASVTNTQVIGMSGFTANISNTVFLNRLNIQLDSSRDIVAGLTNNSPMFTYRNGSGAWWHAGKHPSSDLFLISHGVTTTTSPVVAVTPEGRLGINTLSPTAALNVTENSSGFPIVRVTGSNSPYFELENFAGPTGGFNRFFRIGLDANGKTYFENVNDNYTISRTRILIDSTNNGNIGISTQNPNSKLHIYGDQNTWTDGITLQQGAAGGRSYAISSRNDGLLSFSNETPGENRYLMTFGPGEGNAIIGRIPGVVPIPPANQRLTVIGNLSTTGNLTVNGSISATSIVAIQQPLVIQQALSGLEVSGFLTVNGNVNLSGSNRRLSFGTGISPQYSIDIREETGNIRVGGNYDVPDLSNADLQINKDLSNPLIKLTRRGLASGYITCGPRGLVFNTDTTNNIDFRTGLPPQALSAHTDGTSRLFINNSGNVGIGTTTPNERLTVVGYISASRVSGIGNITLTHPYESGLSLTNSTTNQQWDILNSSPSSPLLTDTLTFFNRNLANNLQPGSNVLVLSGNNVGINTSTPTAKLTVFSGGSEYSNPAISNVAGIYVHNTTNNNANAHAYVSVRSSSVGGGDAFVSYDIAGVSGWTTGIDNSDEDKFKVSNRWDNLDINTRLTITQPGNVGIGTTTPSTKLHVSGSGFNGGGATFEGTDSGNGVNIRGYNGAGINDTTFITLSDNTSSTFTLLSRAGTNAGGEVGRFRIGHGGAERFNILSNGTIGINTIPVSAVTSSRLYINGDATLVGSNRMYTGNLYFDSVPFNWKYTANGFGWGFREDNAGTVNLLAAPNNSSGANAVASVTLSTIAINLTNGNIMLGENLATLSELEVKRNKPAGSVISKIVNASGVTGSQARLDFATGSPNAFSILFQQDGPAPYGEYSHGPALTGGMFFTAASASPIVFRQNVNEAMRISRSGNVGITTSNPQNKLSIRDGDIALIAGENLLDAGRSIRFFANAQDDTTNNYAEIKGGATNAGTSPQQGYLRFNTNGIERMRIDASGNILTTSRILMSADGSNFRWIGATGTSTDGNRIGIGIGTANPTTGIVTDIRLRTADVSRVAVLSSGNVGIGTETPLARLHVSRSDTDSQTLFSGTTRAVRIGTNSSSALIEGVDITGTASYQPLTIGGSNVNFTISGVEHARVHTDGNIGIGTNNPTNKVTINGTGTIIRINGSGAGNFHGIGLRLTDASASAEKSGFIETVNENNHPVTVIGTPVFTNGASDITFSTTPSGSRTSRREIERMRLNSLGQLSLRGSLNQFTPSLYLQSIDASSSVLRSPFIGIANENNIQVAGVFFNILDGANSGASSIDITTTQSGSRTVDRRGTYPHGAINIRNILEGITPVDTITVGIGVLSPTRQIELSKDSAGKPATNTWSIVSDERIKENIVVADTDRCYEIIKELPLKRFTWKNEIYTDSQVPDRSKLGWIAQDVQSVFPKAVTVTPEKTFIPTSLSADNVTIENCLDLNTDQIYAAMYGAIQKLINVVETQAVTISALQTRLETLENNA